MMFQIQFDSLGLPLINTSSKSLSFGLGELFVLETSTKQMLLSSCTTTESKVVVPPPHPIVLVMGKTMISCGAFFKFPPVLAKLKNTLLIFWGMHLLFISKVSFEKLFLLHSS